MKLNRMTAVKITLVVLATLVVGTIFYQTKNEIDMKKKQKKVNVWDTYVTKKDGQIMHFDIIAPIEIRDTSTIYRYGKAYLKMKGQEGQALSSKQCRLCHIEYLRPEWEAEIIENGYFIIEMEGCN